MSETTTDRRPSLLWMLLILILGAVVRFHDIGRQGLWGDEFHSLQTATGYSESHSHKVAYSPLGVVGGLHNDSNIPLYFMLLNLWVRVFGTSEAGIRSLSAVCGLGGIWLIYLVTRKLLPEGTALTSALIMALAPLHVYYAQEARPYAFKVFLILLSTYFFVRIVFSDEKKWFLWAGYLVSSVLAIYTHYFSLFIVFFHNLFLIFFRRNLFFTRRWLLTPALLGLAWLFLFLFMFGSASVNWLQARSAEELAWPYKSPPFILAKFTFSEYSLDLLRISPVVLALGVLLVAGLFLAGLIALKKNHGYEKVAFLLMWLGVPILALIAVDIVRGTKAVAVVRYMITASPGYYIILAAGAMGISRKYLRGAALISVVVLFVLTLTIHYSEPKFEQWREAAQYLEGVSPRPDLLIFYPLNPDLRIKDQQIIHYYAKARPPERVLANGHVAELDDMDKGLNSIVVLIKANSYWVRPEDMDLIVQLMSNHYDLAEIRQWKGVKVLRYARKTFKPPDAPPSMPPASGSAAPVFSPPE